VPEPRRAVRAVSSRPARRRVAPLAQPGRAEQDPAASTPQRSAARAARRPQQQRPGTAPRELLRRRVREVAAIVSGEAEFFARLAGAAVLVRLRHSARQLGAVTGYAVGWPGHVTGAEDIVWYCGGRPTPDLTLPHLRSRWTGTSSRAGGCAARLAAVSSLTPDVGDRAARTVRDAPAAMRNASSPAVAAAIACAAADLLIATAGVGERRGWPALGGRRLVRPGRPRPAPGRGQSGLAGGTPTRYGSPDRGHGGSTAGSGRCCRISPGLQLGRVRGESG
jgi:hypothetical protein